MAQIGTQMFGLAEELNCDLIGTLRAVREIGFEQVEPMVLFSDKQGKRPKNLWAKDTLETVLPVLRDLGMTIPSMHIGVGYGWMNIPVNVIAKNILFLQERTGTSTFVISGLFRTLPQTKHWAKLLKNIEHAVHDSHVQILYHNHDDEFQTISCKGISKSALNVFFDLTGADVKLQLDIGWAALAGDEAAIAKHYADRIVSLHLKDFYPDFCSRKYNRNSMPASAFAPIGSGGVKTKEILALQPQFPHFNSSIIIDQDKYSGNMLESLKTGFDQVKDMLNESA